MKNYNCPSCNKTVTKEMIDNPLVYEWAIRGLYL